MMKNWFVAFSTACLISNQAFSVTCDARLGGEHSRVENAEELATRFRGVLDQLGTRVINQRYLLNRMMVAAVTGGHIIIEGVTGNGKTSTTLEFAKAVSGQFSRIQFTVDTTPSELTGYEIYNQQTHEFEFHPGGLQGNIVLADEINRATPKTQGAMLQAMEENEITVNRKSHKLPKFFMVVATQNPSRQMGTFPLPEAQLDRFTFMVLSEHNDIVTEEQILEVQIQKRREQLSGTVKAIADALKPEDILVARDAMLNMQMTPEARQYILKLVDATRNPLAYSKELSRYLREGVGSRATFALEFASRGLAWLNGKKVVEISDVKEIEKDALRHRLMLSDEAKTEEVSVEKVLQTLIKAVEDKK